MKLTFKKSLAIILTSLALTLSAIGITPAYAAGPWYVAPGGSDGNDCLSPATACATINGAIAKATSGDTIEVAAGTYTASTGAQVVLVNKSITLSGGWDAGFTTQSGLSTIDGGAARRGMMTSADPVVVDHFQVQNGFDESTAGGIYNTSTLTLNNSVVSGNVGGLAAGGIYNNGTLTINDTTISGNTMGQVGYSGGGGGGGIENYGTATLNNSTVSANIILGNFSGSGIHALGTITLNNSTVTGNTGGGGEGIYSNFGTVVLNSSTISNNQSYGLVGIYSDVTLQNTIIAGNNGTGSDCNNSIGFGGTVVSMGYNLIGNGASCSLTPATGDQVGTSAHRINPLLGLLQNNGGPTFTHALSSGSPAFEAGNPAVPGSGGSACPATDQRGIARSDHARCDIGAYEVDVPFTIPALLAPAGIIIDTTPTYSWTSITGATAYQYQLLKGSKTIYSKTIPASTCGASTCSNTPKTLLNTGAYKWKIRAMIAGVWKDYSAYQVFTISAAKPGFWKGSGLEFYVTNTNAKVDNFAIFIRINGCGNYKITHAPLVSITNKNFSFKGSFYTNGTFSSPTAAKGTLGLKSFHIPGCGYLTGGPFSWSAKWKNANQPTAMIGSTEENPFITITPEPESSSNAMPELDSLFNLFSIDPDTQ